MPRMLHPRSAVLDPDDAEFARGTRNVPNVPIDLDAPEGELSAPYLLAFAASS